MGELSMGVVAYKKGYTHSNILFRNFFVSLDLQSRTKMKKLIFILMAEITFTQTYEDVVILIDGSEIHGTIIEQKQNEYIKIQSGKNIFVFQIEELVLIKKELVKASNDSSAIFNKKSSIGIGLTNKSFNYIQYTYDFKLSRNTALFVLLGYGNALGVGLAVQNNYNDNGMMLGLSSGTNVNGNSFANISVAYQWRLGKKSHFLSLGLSSYAFRVTNHSLYSSHTEVTKSMIPIIAYDYRF